MDLNSALALLCVIIILPFEVCIESHGISEMRSTFRYFQAANRGLVRSRTTSFIGLGRMGYQMAYNLFSKQHIAKENDSRFIVCDVVPDASRAFCTEFMKQYPNAQLSIADTPEE